MIKLFNGTVILKISNECQWTSFWILINTQRRWNVNCFASTATEEKMHCSIHHSLFTKKDKFLSVLLIAHLRIGQLHKMWTVAWFILCIQPITGTACYKRHISYGQNNTLSKCPMLQVFSLTMYQISHPQQISIWQHHSILIHNHYSKGLCVLKILSYFPKFTTKKVNVAKQYDIGSATVQVEFQFLFKCCFWCS